jgi:hypothetical protein
MPRRMPAAAAPITYVALTLNNTERSGFVRANQALLPELELFLAVNGYSKEETIRRLGSTPLKFHPYTFCNAARFATFGSLANFASKYLALRMQVRRRLPYMAMLEDDMQLRPGFKAFVEQTVRHGALDRADLLVLGAWGEGYVTSLASARRVPSPSPLPSPSPSLTPPLTLTHHLPPASLSPFLPP